MIPFDCRVEVGNRDWCTVSFKTHDTRNRSCELMAPCHGTTLADMWRSLALYDTTAGGRWMIRVSRFMRGVACLVRLRLLCLRQGKIINVCVDRRKHVLGFDVEFDTIVPRDEVSRRHPTQRQALLPKFSV